LIDGKNKPFDNSKSLKNNQPMVRGEFQSVNHFGSERFFQQVVEYFSKRAGRL